LFVRLSIIRIIPKTAFRTPAGFWIAAPGVLDD
jgi:hypothetical protein